MSTLLRFISSPKQWGYLTTNVVPSGLTTAPWTNNHLTHHQTPFNNLYLVFNGRLAAPKTLAKDNRLFYGIRPFSIQNNPGYMQPLLNNPAHLYHHYMMKNILNSATTLPNIHPITSVQNSIQPISYKPRFTTQVLPQVTLTVPGNTYETITTTSQSKQINYPTTLSNADDRAAMARTMKERMK